MESIATPYYLIDKKKLQQHLLRLGELKARSEVKLLLALKCFATWGVFDEMSKILDGTTSSSLYEVKLGKEKFAGETHAYSVAFSDGEIEEVIHNADKIIFNSISQLKRFQKRCGSLPIGLRVNPGVSSSEFIIADPSRPNSRLGVSSKLELEQVLNEVSGLMFHFNCENSDFPLFDTLLTKIENQFGEYIAKMQWLSLGGGIDFVAEKYPLQALADRLKAFAEKYQVQIYLEPGQASINDCASLEVSVLDIVNNGMDIAIVDASIEAHMLDLLIYRETATVTSNQGQYIYQICGKSCLAGDIFGTFRFEQPLKVGDRISFENAAGYTMVKKNWFNGLNMPSIVIKGLDGCCEIQQSFCYDDYVASLS